MPSRKIDLGFDLRHVEVLDADGYADPAFDPQIPADDLRALYRAMLLVRAHDEQRLRLQRQGRIGTFAPVKGQEAAQLGSVWALRATDWVVPSFRETAVAVWRGARLEDDLLYAAGYEEGIRIPEDGRDLPLAIPVASQLVHAVGLAFARRQQGADDVVAVYFGDGATSEGDFHEALNLAAVWNAPVVFVCQNNQYAISVPRGMQTASRTLAQKAFAYDMAAVVVDGNDLLAVARVTLDAVERARRGEGPTLVEAVTYRLGVHTTADDPTKYRSAEEEREWAERDPIPRLLRHLLRLSVATEEDDARWREEAASEVERAVRAFEAERERLGDPLAMYDHVYATPPPRLRRQRAEHAARLAKDDAGAPPEQVTGRVPSPAAEAVE